jgi:glycerophosphoryl diester phosphodiesterase
VLALAAAKLGLAPVVRLALRGIVALQVPESALGLHVTSPRTLARFHNAGVEVHIWTVNDPSRMRQLLLLGVDGIITDRADLALQVVETLNIEPH